MGRFETLADLGGALLAGDFDDVAEGCATIEEARADLVVFDLRLTFDRWLEQSGLLAPILSTSS